MRQRPSVGAGLYKLRFLPDRGATDANGCPSQVHETPPTTIAVPVDFYQGSGFAAGVTAYEFGTLETTELVGGRPKIRVTNPTDLWLRAYGNFASCHRNPSEVFCVAAAPVIDSDDWLAAISGFVMLGALVAFLLYFVRPASPVRRRRRFKMAHRPLARSLERRQVGLTPNQAEEVKKHLTELQKHLEAELSETQRRWFSDHLASGRLHLAVEVSARWLAEGRVPISSRLRTDLEWMASTLEIEHLVLPILEYPESGSTDRSPGTGCEVPLDTFKELVREAVDALPAELGKAMTNVAIIVEEENSERSLFGLYVGVPLTARRHFQWSVHPDRIYIYRRTICSYCQTEEQVRAQVYRTVVHEIAHHFGISDDRLRELGWG